MMSHARSGRAPQPPDREPGPVGLLARLFLTQLLVVLAIAAVITSVFALAGSDNTGDEAGTANGAAAQPSASDSPSAPATTTATAAPTSSEPVTPSAPATSASEPKLPKVDVLNQSAGGNAAGRTADLLRAAGWRIGRVDDFRGNVSMTTVYYPLGLTEAAKDVAADMPGEPRVMERFSTISDKRVTVILVD